MNRPEYIKCIKHCHGVLKGNWCGREEQGFFQSTDHAAYSNIAGNRLVPCPECVNAVTEALRKNIE